VLQGNGTQNLTPSAESGEGFFLICDPATHRRSQLIEEPYMLNLEVTRISVDQAWLGARNMSSCRAWLCLIQRRDRLASVSRQEKPADAEDQREYQQETDSSA
jgi:hypothetical protein